MNKQHISQVKKKYAVKLGIGVGSFYDPYSGCNLFLKTPYFFFDNEPTKAIINGVKSGKLIDLKGNINIDGKSAPTSNASVDVDKLKAQLRKEIESEVRAEMAANADAVNADTGEAGKAEPKAKSKKAKEE